MLSIRNCFVPSPSIGVVLAICAITPVHAQQFFAQVEPVNPIGGTSSALLASLDAVSFNSAAPALIPAAANAGAPASVQPIPAVQSSVEVDAARQSREDGLVQPYHVTQSEILSSAGTWGDFSRFLQLLPGVAWNSDMSNDVMVRGGNPSENLYVVDGIEVPNINHLAVEGATGGFTSMLDTSTIASVDMKAGAYDARYSSRLSSLIEVHTRESRNAESSREPESSREMDLGISGAGGFMQLPLGPKAGLLLSAHRSVLNLVTNDIGINGVPIYTDGMASLEFSTSKDHVSALSLNGADSINITPQPCDNGVTLQVQTQYGGARSTDGLVWQHTFGPSILSTVTASYSAQNQQIGQQWQSTAFDHRSGCASEPIEATPVYQEQTHDGISTLSYALQLEKHGWLYSVGATGRLTAMDYAVAQPQGQLSPFNPNPTWTDADNFARKFIAGQTAVYAEATGTFSTRWSVIAGAREETFALSAAHVFEPRASLAFRINGHQSIDGAFARSAQLAPAINILSYPGNGLLRPLQVRQYSLGADLWRGSAATASVAAYRKDYSNEPVSTEYPSLMLANMVDTLGQQFVWLPLTTGGHGRAEGVELLVRAHAAARVQLLASASYSRTRYAAADHILRPGNFDFPLAGNGLATIEMPARFELSVRNTYASGRPYTPFNLPLSEQQSRGIYDLTRINALRGSAYDRVDADFNRDLRIRRGVLNIHAGVENALNRKNFLGYAWMNNCHPTVTEPDCGTNANALPGVPETRLTQMPRFPSAGMHLKF